MTQLPWRADVRLEPDTVAELARDAFGIPCNAVQTLGEGWDFITYLADGEWVLRLPKRSECDTALLRERELLERLAAIELPVPIPRFAHFAGDLPGFPWHAAGYRFVPGVPLTNVTDATIRDSVAADLGEFLATLHAMPDISMFTSPWPDDEDWVARIVTDSRECYPRDLYARIERFLADGFPDEPELPTVLAHADLFDDHIVVDPTTGRLAGVIDWTDAYATFRTVDFAGLHFGSGRRRAEIAFASYGDTPSETEWRWLEHRSIVIATEEIYYGSKANEPARVDVALERARALLAD